MNKDLQNTVGVSTDLSISNFSRFRIHNPNQPKIGIVKFQLEGSLPKGN